MRAVFIAPFLLIFWAFIEWRSDTRGRFMWVFCLVGLHRWKRILSDPGREVLGRYCPNCKRAEAL